MSIKKQITSWLLRCSSAFGLCLLAAIPAVADQCSYITKEQALNAIARLELNQDLYFLCEPCGEEIPKLTNVNHLAMTKVDFEDYWQIKINGQGIDLAYVFVNSGIENEFINLAAIANCPAQSVSPLLPINGAISEDEAAESR